LRSADVAEERQEEVTRANSSLRAATILVSSTLLLVISHYHTLLGDDCVSSFILYFLIPLGIIVFVFREDPRKFGLTLGDWKKGVVFSVLGVALMAVVIGGLAQLEEFQQYYKSGILQQPQAATLVEFALRAGIYMFSWEFIFRGFMLFGLKERFGSLAIWIQAIPFAIMHLGKPELETLSTIFGGAAFAYVDLESKSVLPSVVIHWGIYMLMVLAATWV
jgi:membrane protease YdiL (CAAX protease family)